MLKRVADESLPYHITVKDIPSIDNDGKSCTINGIKMEMFVFDAFVFSTKMVAYAVERIEFSPVKNASSTTSLVVDSPDTARRDVYALHTQYLRAAGATIEGMFILIFRPH